MQMGSELEIVEQRLKSFTGQLQTEVGILERLVYKHKNQHRRCNYFQYILKVRRDLKLLKLANLEEILDASFLVINGNRPKQKVQLLESLKRRKCGGGKYNFLERLLGVTRLLSQMIEPLIKAAMEISTLLARSFFMKFSLTILAVIARIRVLIQQILLDAVLLYNTVSSLSQREQTVKLNQDGFEVFREYFPKKQEATIVLECIWQTDKYVLVERTSENEMNNPEDDHGDVLPSSSKIQYENIEAFLGVDESDKAIVKTGSEADPPTVEENGCDSHLDKDHIQDASLTDGVSAPNTVLSEDTSTSSPERMMVLENDDDGSCIASTPYGTSASKEEACMLPTSSRASPLSSPVNKQPRNPTKKNKVAFVSVKPPAPSSTRNQSTFDPMKNGVDKEDSFFNLLTGGSKKRSLV